MIILIIIIALLLGGVGLAVKALWWLIIFGIAVLVWGAVASMSRRG